MAEKAAFRMEDAKRIGGVVRAVEQAARAMTARKTVGPTFLRDTLAGGESEMIPLVIDTTEEYYDEETGISRGVAIYCGWEILPDVSSFDPTEDLTEEMIGPRAAPVIVGEGEEAVELPNLIVANMEEMGGSVGSNGHDLIEEINTARQRLYFNGLVVGTHEDGRKIVLISESAITCIPAESGEE